MLTRAKANAVMRSAVAYEDARRQGATPEQAQVVKQIPACETNPATRVGHDVQDSAAETSVPNRRRTVVCLCVDEAGVLTQDPIVAASSGSPKMDEAANTIAKGASGQYRPAMVDGKPVAGCFQLAITFKAQKPE
jgi:Gram-negative bacterial TonB protein C-terminal